MPTEATSALLHITGYVTGATLYAMLLVLLVRAGSTDGLARGTAVLGLAWNVGELAAHGASLFDAARLAAWFAATAYGALGLLAAVVVHSVSRGHNEPHQRRRLALVVAVMAYATGGVAALLHLRAAALGAPLPSPLALDITTAGLAATAVPLVITTRRQHHWRRALWMSALAIFGVSALHLGRFHGPGEPWIAELIGHHASIPLAFAMLYRDYRFALADLFLKRGLTLLVLVAIVLTGYTAMAPDLQPRGPGAVAALLVAWGATAWLFPAVRRVVHGFVDRIVLSRANYARLTDDLAQSIQSAETIDAVLARAVAALAAALETASVRGDEARDQPLPAGAHALVIPTADPPHFSLVVGPLTGGRRLLSDDVAMLDRVRLIVARRIDAIRITAERYDRVIREREMAALATEAELRALRAQVNPHFLFNALTTIGYLIQHAPSRARETLLQLTTLLRAVLKSDGELTSLGRERDLVEAYLRIEQARFDDRLTTRIDIPPHLAALRIPPLVVQPLVENAIKHGVAPSRTGGHVSLTATLQTSESGTWLQIVVANTGVPLGTGTSGNGVGVPNVSRRLEHCYGGAATFALTRTGTNSTAAELRIPIDTDLSIELTRTGTGR